MKTLRGQLTAWFLGLITLMGIASAVGTGLVSFGEVNGFLDDQLRQIALSVGDTPSAAGESSRIIAGADPDDRIIIHILDNNFKTIRNSDPQVDLPVETVTGFYNHESQGLQWRTFTLIAENRAVQVSQQTEIRTAAAISSMANTLFPLALLIPLAWVMVGFVVRRVLMPLHALASGLHARKAGSNVELSPAGIPGELVPVVDAMNDILVRQHELLEFRQRFVSDAAHQLRTPLTAFSLQLENAKRILTPTGSAAMLQPLEQGLARMSALLTQLLKLARADHTRPPQASDTVSLPEVVRASVADIYQSASSKGIDLGLVRDEEAEVEGDRLDLVMLLGNLLDNAVRYTAEGGTVDVEVRAMGPSAVVTVTDSGPGIPEDALPLVFNRFYRHDPSASEGSGLGLSIAAALAARNQAKVTLRNRKDGHGLVAEVTFRRHAADA